MPKLFLFHMPNSSCPSVRSRNIHRTCNQITSKSYYDKDCTAPYRSITWQFHNSNAGDYQNADRKTFQLPYVCNNFIGLSISDHTPNIIITQFCQNSIKSEIMYPDCDFGKSFLCLNSRKLSLDVYKRSQNWS